MLQYSFGCTMKLIAVFLLCVLACQVGGRIRSQKRSRNRGPVRSQARIVGGSQTTIASYPYQVSIMSGGSHICGGAIIDQDTIITAAHCVQSATASDLSIRAGSDFRTTGGTVITAKSYEKHPRFSATTLDFDMALIHLSEKLTYSDKIKAVPLYAGRIPAGRAVVATGWGTTSEGGVLSNNLRKATFKTIALRVCKRIWGNGLDRSMFCVGRMAGGKDTCQGDSGGPVTLNGALIGITSHGNGCGRRGYPGLYTRVPLTRPWILANLNG